MRIICVSPIRREPPSGSPRRRTLLEHGPSRGRLHQAGQDTRHAATQKDRGAKVAETGESVTRRKEQEARGIGQSAELHTAHHHATRKAHRRQALLRSGYKRCGQSSSGRSYHLRQTTYGSGPISMALLPNAEQRGLNQWSSMPTFENIDWMRKEGPNALNASLAAPRVSCNDIDGPKHSVSRPPTFPPSSSIVPLGETSLRNFCCRRHTSRNARCRRSCPYRRD